MKWLKLKLSKIKAFFVKIKDFFVKGWRKFDSWVASWAPGLKTKIATGLGALGMFAATMQDYITGLPLDKFITSTEVAIISAVLFTLSFWFRTMATSKAD